jgi:hypothetical protein
VTAYLSLDGLELDPALIRRLPRALALHHLALVVAEDEDSITVALADPTNPTARQRVESALGDRLALVRSDADAIRAALDQAWSADTARGGVLVGGATPLLPQLTDYAQKVVLSALPSLHIDPALPPRLLLTAEDDPTRCAESVLSAPTSVWLCLDPARPLRRIVVATRTGPPDWQAVEWAGQLARAHGSEVVLLAAAPPAHGAILSGHAAYLSPADARGAHVTDLTLILSGYGVEGRLRVRQGSFTEVAIAECASSHPPDLLIIGAEKSGEQAAYILSQVSGRLAGLLVLKA